MTARWDRRASLEARLRATLDTVHDAVIVIDADGVVVDANRAVSSLLGWSSEALVGRNVSALMPEPDRSAHDGYVRRHLETGHAAIIGRGREVVALHADGTRVPIELAVNRLELEGAVYFCGTLRDLSAQKAAEAKLQEQHALLRELLAERTHLLHTSDQFLGSALDALSPHIAILDAALDIVVVNRGWRDFGAKNGLPPGTAAVGASYAAALDRAVAAGDPDAGIVRARLASLIAGEAAEVTHEYPCHSPDGTRRWFLMRATRFVCARGLFVVVAHEVVTERRVAHDELVEREAMLRAVIDTAPDAILVVDENEHLELVGHALAALPVRPVPGRPMSALMSAGSLAAAREHGGRALATGEVVQYEARGSEEPGLEDRWFSVRVKRLLVPGRPPKLLVFYTDVTEQKTTATQLAVSQDQLRQAQKMEAVGQLAGGIAHDFNNLLTAVRHHAAFALERVQDENVADEIRQIDQTAERATDLTRQLLAFGRRQTLEPEVLDPAVLADDLLPMLRRLVGSRIRIEAEFEPDARCLRVDRGQFQQVITNLVLNARDAIEGSGSVRITSRREVRAGADLVVLSVRDDGVGMSPEVQARIFEPFFSTKGPSRGTGLGLAMVYGIVSQSGGTITVASEPGRGSEFTILLPRAICPTASGPSAARGSSAPATVRGETVLLVEDEPILRRATQRALEAEGYAVIVATRPADALRVAADLAIRLDVLLSDVIMPEMSGAELAHRIRTLRPSLRTLLVSGYTADAVRAEDLDELAFLAKPFTPRELLVRLRQLLDAPAGAVPRRPER